MVREFQSVIGREARAQMLAETGRLPSVVVACVGGGSNAIGIFAPFYDDPVRLIGVEAAGRGLNSGAHAASITGGRPGVLHGSFSYLLQDEDGQVLPTHSVSAGLDYPGVGPEHAFLNDQHRAEYVSVTDEQALAALHQTSRLEGIIPALESSHAIAHDVPLLFMTYLNPILAFGLERFCRAASDAGIDGLIVPDLPPVESADLRRAADATKLDLVFFVAPTSSEVGIEAACRAATGFVYGIAVTGVTGARAHLDEGVLPLIASVRRHTTL